MKRFLVLLACLSALHAQTEIWTIITAQQGVTTLSLSVAEFDLAQQTAELADDAATTRAVLLKDLTGSMFFRIRTPGEGKLLASAADKVDFKGWAACSASVLVAADFSTSNLTLRMYDLVSQRLIASKEYSRDGNDRALGHRVADEIIRLLTGEEGVSTSRIVFARRGNGARELYTVDQDGLNLQQLTNRGLTQLSPDWSPDGERIAYSAYWGHQLVVFALNVSTKKSSIITDDADMSDTPAWSPDGSRLALSLNTAGGQEVFLMDATGGNRQQVTRNNAVSTSPCWAPNGQQIAYVSDRAGSPQVYIINTDGTDQRRLTFEGNYNTSPAWSPRGNLIAFSRRDGGGNQVCITDIQGETVKQLTWSGSNYDPCFSPDGLHIVFVSTRDGSEDLYVMNWDGTDQRRLTTIGGCTNPSWSPALKQ